MVVGEELAFTGFKSTTATPGTTGPTLICIRRFVTTTGVPGEEIFGTVAPEVLPEVFDAVCPASGKLVVPVGATATPGEPVKKKKYTNAPSPRTAMAIAAMIRVRCILMW